MTNVADTGITDLYSLQGNWRLTTSSAMLTMDGWFSYSLPPAFVPRKPVSYRLLPIAALRPRPVPTALYTSSTRHRQIRQLQQQQQRQWSGPGLTLPLSWTPTDWPYSTMTDLAVNHPALAFRLLPGRRRCRACVVVRRGGCHRLGVSSVLQPDYPAGRASGVRVLYNGDAPWVGPSVGGGMNWQIKMYGETTKRWCRSEMYGDTREILLYCLYFRRRRQIEPDTRSFAPMFKEREVLQAIYIYTVRHVCFMTTPVTGPSAVEEELTECHIEARS